MLLKSNFICKVCVLNPRLYGQADRSESNCLGPKTWKHLWLLPFTHISHFSHKQILLAPCTFTLHPDPDHVSPAQPGHLRFTSGLFQQACQPILPYPVLLPFAVSFQHCSQGGPFENLSQIVSVAFFSYHSRQKSESYSGHRTLEELASTGFFAVIYYSCPHSLCALNMSGALQPQHPCI